MPADSHSPVGHQIGAQYELQAELDFNAGCALVPVTWKSLSLNELASHADAALQQAKKQGRCPAK